MRPMEEISTRALEEKILEYKDSSVQCNLFEEYCLEIMQNDNLMRNCCCFESFLDNFNFSYKMLNKLEIELINENSTKPGNSVNIDFKDNNSYNCEPRKYQLNSQEKHHQSEYDENIDSEYIIYDNSSSTQSEDYVLKIDCGNDDAQADISNGLRETQEIYDITIDCKLEDDDDGEDDYIGEIGNYSIDSTELNLLIKENDDEISEIEMIDIYDDEIEGKKSKKVEEFSKLDNCFVCNVCSKNCTSLAAVKAHIASHLQKSTLCYRCGKIFADYKVLLSHQALPCKVVQGKNQLNDSINDDYENLNLDFNQRKNLSRECKICGKKFDTTRKYFDHMNVHYNKKPYKCSTCPTQISNYANFIVHVRKFQCPPEGLIIPRYAPQGLLKRKKIKPNVNKAQKSNFKCRICNFIGSRYSYFVHFTKDQHLCMQAEWQHKYQIKEFSCTYCDYQFNNLFDCIKHRRQYHRKYPNNDFLEWLENNQNLISTKELPKNGVDYCPICRLRFNEPTFSEHLCSDAHLLLETKWLQNSKINEIRCTDCLEMGSFENLFNLMIHRISEHNFYFNSDENQLSIKELITWVVSPKLLLMTPDEKGDITTKQGNLISTSDVGGLEYCKIPCGKYLCRICKKTFKKRLSYFDHQVGHHKKIKPYHCPCGFNSSYYDSFLKHCRKNRCSIVGRIMPSYAPKTFQYHNKMIQISEENVIEEPVLL